MASNSDNVVDLFSDPSEGEDFDLEPQQSPTGGEVDRGGRASRRRVTRRVSSDAEDQCGITEVECRQLRLEKVNLVGVGSEGTIAEIEASLEELVAPAETAGSEV